jgi:hypothetical protein
MEVPKTPQLGACIALEGNYNLSVDKGKKSGADLPPKFAT